MEQKLITEQSQKLELRQILSPTIIYSLEILQANILELNQKIETELEENPLLEIDTNDDSEYNENEFKNEDTVLNLTEDEIEQYYDDGTDIGYITLSQNNDENDAGEVIEKVVTYEISLQDYLLEQIKYLNFNEIENAIALTIISSLDDNGFFKDSETNIASYFQISEEKVKEVLKKIQELEPEGVGTKTPQECLLFQLEKKKLTDTLAYEILKNFYEEYITKKFDKIIKTLEITEEEFKDADNLIKTLHPIPVQNFGKINEDIYIEPDVTVNKVSNEWVIIINDERIPKLKINKNYYNKYLNTNDENLKNFLHKKYDSAILLIKAIYNRSTTIYKVTNEILNAQKEFFETGDKMKLKPLTLKEIAQKLNLNESTISRAISNKYIETPYGIFSFKFFFSSSMLMSNTSEVISRNIILEKIKELIENENKNKPLSDTEIWKILNQKGFKIERRTVTKYRSELGYLPKHHRKKI
ncbi:MAG TPA: RNA polymerase factor sigma-54 [bacterium]|nr:RNA polymerase factor sigma-54 [bacterium]HOL47797.1 RNA polymerase factor sigma-54 [bacterium]HPQ18632.1 RNA polymerase factor sigma-54 [bacterium]